MEDEDVNMTKYLIIVLQPWASKFLCKALLTGNKMLELSFLMVVITTPLLLVKKGDYDEECKKNDGYIYTGTY